MRLDGQHTFSVPVDVFWTRITDLPFIVSALPDVSKIKSIDENVAVVVVQPKFAFVQTDFDLNIEQRPGEPNRSVEWILQTKGIGSSSRVLATMELEPNPRGTLMHWSATVEELGGLLKLVPGGLIEAAARRVITDVLASIEDKMDDTMC